MDIYYENCKIVDFGGYPAIYMPDHPHAFESCGLVRLHVLIMEKHLGRKLTQSECVHHIDKNKYNYQLENLMLFRSSADHLNYHKALEDSTINYRLERINGVYTCKLMNSKQDTGRYVCPICGGRKSSDGRMCLSCKRQSHQSFAAKLSNQEFVNLLNNYSLEAIGRMYGVTGNAVKKQAKQLGIYQSKYMKCPDVAMLMHQLSSGSVAQTAKYFGVSSSTIKTWMSTYHVKIDTDRYVCIETGYSTTVLKTAVEKYYADQNHVYARRQIQRCCLNHNAYRGLHWEKISRRVYVEN